MNIKKKPIISVVTVCYNSEDTLEETMQSVLSQDYDLLDYVIIDGGSTDGTLDIVEKYRSKLGYFISEPDKGISDAFNKGVKASKGDLIVIINSDDILLPGALRQVAEYYEEGKWDIYRCKVVVRNKETGYAGSHVPFMKFPLIPLRINVDHQGTFVTPETHKKWGYYDLNMRYMMDHDFMARCYQGGARMKYVPVDVAEFRLGGVSSAHIPAKRYDLEHIVLNQGGSRFQAKICYWYFCLFDFAKRIFIRIFGQDNLKRLTQQEQKTK